jgi:hypothetical protein
MPAAPNYAFESAGHDRQHRVDGGNLSASKSFPSITLFRTMDVTLKMKRHQSYLILGVAGEFLGRLGCRAATIKYMPVMASASSASK